MDEVFEGHPEGGALSIRPTIIIHLPPNLLILRRQHLFPFITTYVRGCISLFLQRFSPIILYTEYIFCSFVLLLLFVAGFVVDFAVFEHLFGPFHVVASSNHIFLCYEIVQLLSHLGRPFIRKWRPISVPNFIFFKEYVASWISQKQQIFDISIVQGYFADVDDCVGVDVFEPFAFEVAWLFVFDVFVCGFLNRPCHYISFNIS